MITRDPLAYRAPLNADHISTRAKETATGLAEPPASLGLNYIRCGRGEPLLLLHSLGGSLIQWSPVLDRLARHRELIAVDMPGFGESRPLPDGIKPTAANLASAVLEFYDSLALGSEPHVAGISLGGWAAIECARQGHARSVVAICPAGFWKKPLEPRPSHSYAAARAMRPLAQTLRIPAVRRRAMPRIFRHPERIPGADAVRIARAYAGGPAYVEANRLMRAGTVGDLSGISVPITLAWAEYDNLVRREPLREGILPGRVKQVRLPGCGHVPTWDDPDLVAQVILKGTGGA
jgi:pimeloyl-ACP methyl ester carboxylesterase